MQNLTISEYNSLFNKLHQNLKDNVYIGSTTIVHYIKDSILTIVLTEDSDKSEVNTKLDAFNIGEQYVATDDSFDISRILLVLYFIIDGYNKCTLNKQVRNEVRGKSFGYDMSDIISELLSIERNEEIFANDIKIEFSQNTGLKLRDMSFSEYMRSDYYSEDIKLVERLFSDEYQSLDPYISKINSSVDGILSAYASLFESGFDLSKPLGVFDDRNYYYVKNNKLVVEPLIDANGNPTVSLEKMLVANYLASPSFGFRGSDSLVFDYENTIVKNVYNNIPKLILRFALGCVASESEVYNIHPEYGGSWIKYKEKVIRPYLTNNIFKQCTDIMLKSGKSYTDILVMYDELSSILKRCCLVLEWNTSLSIKLRILTPDSTVDQHMDFAQDLFSSIFNNVGEIVDNSEGNLLDVKIIKDVKAYNFEPIFAYQALDALKESKRMPSWENVILGRKADDKTFTYDFSQFYGYHVVAASRSGKGVMCLNILAAALGSGYPIFYLDSKPDMARTIKGICNNAVVCTAESIQGLDIPETDFLTYPDETAKVLLGKSSYTNYGGIAYLKLLELAFLIAELRYQVAENGMTGISREELGVELDKKTGKSIYSRLIIFVDELEKATVHLNDTLKICIESSEPFKATKKEIKDNAGEDGEIIELSPNAPAYAVLANKIVNWEFKVASEIAMSGKATLGKARMHLMYIYQAYNQTKTGKLDHSTEHIFSTLKSLPTTANIIGASAEYYPEPALKLPQLSKNLTKEKRWFSLSTVNTGVLEAQSRTLDAIKTGGITLFKPYLILNDSDINAPCVQEYLDGKEDRIRRFTKDGLGEELIDSRIGFCDYVNDMLSVDNTGNTVQSLLSKGNVIAESVVKKLGYSSVNDYLFDFSIESFKSISDLVDLIKNGVSIRQSIESSEPVNPNFSFDANMQFKETAQESQINITPNIDIETQRVQSDSYNIFNTSSADRIASRYGTTQSASSIENIMENSMNNMNRTMLEAQARQALSNILSRHPDWKQIWTEDMCEILISNTVNAYLAQGGN